MKTRCELCFHHCALGEGQTGLCRARGCRDGVNVSLSYGKLTSLALDPIEKTFATLSCGRGQWIFDLCLYGKLLIICHDAAGTRLDNSVLSAIIA